MYTKILAIFALVASASAFTTQMNPRSSMALGMSDDGFVYGKYDDKLYDNEAKKELYNSWDPNSPRSTMNFNPFETFKGNTPDASGIYPGEPRYKDPKRGDVSFQAMMDERKEAEEREANPKPGDVPGAPGCKN